MTPTQAVTYLVNHGLLDRDDLVAGDLHVTPVTRRHRNYRITQGQRDYFVKTTASPDRQNTESLRREATIYWMIESARQARTFASEFPKCYGYDPRRHVLVLEYVDGCVSVAARSLASPAFPFIVSGRVGAALGALHRTLRELALPAQLAAFEGAPPWILRAHRFDARSTRAPSGGSAEWLQLMRENSALHPFLDAAHDQWRRTSLVHGDFKFDNCLVREEDGVRATTWLVDFELVDVGDPAWDIGAGLQSYMSAHISAAGKADSPNASGAPLQRSLRSFWEGYVSSAACPENSHELLERSVAYAALRLLLAGYEGLQFAPRVSANERQLMEFSLTLLHRTRPTAEWILGELPHAA
jgi:aminoglycoside phosphotransferase (APT) family kinase protein